ncbi:MAG TPA: hypothetical protein VIV60_01870 [Polyangiaceae bacterium]
MWLKSWIIVLTTCAWTGVAGAEANACASAYERAQELRAQQQLRDALGTLRTCVNPSCSEFVRTECNRWLGEVEAAIPSIVLAVRSGDKDLQDVRVMCDNAELVTGLDGRAVAVDPGPHTLTFVVENAPSVELTLVFREGEKNRLVTANISQPRRSPAAPRPTRSNVAPSSERSRPTWPTFALGGLSVIGVGGFVALGLRGNSEVADRERTCSPGCTDAELRPARTSYLLADISLGVGVLSLGAAGYWLLTAPSPTTTRSAVGKNGQFFDFRFSNNGGYATVRSQF